MLTLAKVYSPHLPVFAAIGKIYANANKWFLYNYYSVIKLQVKLCCFCYSLDVPFIYNLSHGELQFIQKHEQLDETLRISVFGRGYSIHYTTLKMATGLFGRILKEIDCIKKTHIYIYASFNTCVAPEEATITKICVRQKRSKGWN